MNREDRTESTISLEQDCREQGRRMTGQRLVILTVLDRATDHPDAVELHRCAAAIDARISLATVYRKLRLLQDRGILARHAFADGRSRYETASERHHDHLIDIETGHVIEFHAQEIVSPSRGEDIHRPAVRG